MKKIFHVFQVFSFEVFLSDKLKCVIGLHACGDFSAMLLHHFIARSDIAVLILFPCCYHKFSVYDNSHRQKWKQTDEQYNTAGWFLIYS